MRRRRILAGLLLTLAAPLAAEAQRTRKMWRIGYLRSTDSPVLSKAFLQGLNELGYVEGRDFVMEYRFAEGRPDRYPALAADLVRAQVDVIVTAGTPATMAAKRATQTIPIVFASASDVVEKGIVESLARPGGNTTGLQIQVSWTKRLQLLKDAVPTVTRVAYLHDQSVNPGQVLEKSLRVMHAAAQAQNVSLQPVAMSDPNDLPKAFTEFGPGTNGLIVQPAPALVFLAGEIGRLAIQRRLPAMGYGRVFADAGCLMSHGENLAAQYHRAALYVDRIFKGAKPAVLPVEQPTTFELVINLKTAKALGLTIPPAVLLQADQVIE
jgi:putative ABC transport system substrate-binding protein